MYTHFTLTLTSPPQPSSPNTKTMGLLTDSPSFRNDLKTALLAVRARTQSKGIQGIEEHVYSKVRVTTFGKVAGWCLNKQKFGPKWGTKSDGTTAMLKSIAIRNRMSFLLECMMEYTDKCISKLVKNKLWTEEEARAVDVYYLFAPFLHLLYAA